MSKETMAGEEGPEIEPEVVIPGETQPPIKLFAKDHIPGMHIGRNEDTVRVPHTPTEHQQATETAEQFLAEKVGEVVEKHAPEQASQVEPQQVAGEMLQQIHSTPDLRPGTTPAELAMADPTEPTRGMFDPAWDVTELAEQLNFSRMDIERNETEILGVNVSAYRNELRYYKTRRRVRGAELQAIEEAEGDFIGRLVVDKLFVALKQGNVEAYSDTLIKDFNKEVCEGLWRIPGVREAVEGIEKGTRGFPPGAELRVGSNFDEAVAIGRQMIRNRLVNEHGYSNEQAEDAAQVALQLIHATLASVKFASPEKGGVLVENQVRDKIFPAPPAHLLPEIILFAQSGQPAEVAPADIKDWCTAANLKKINTAGNPSTLTPDNLRNIDMNNEEYWMEWDQMRRDKDLKDLKLGDLPVKLPYVIGRVCFTPEFLKGRTNSLADGLRRALDVRLRGLEYFLGASALSDLFDEHGKCRDFSSFAFASIVKGGSGLVDKFDGGFLRQPLDSPRSAFEKVKEEVDAQKVMATILKFLFDLKDLFFYVSYYGDAEAPEKMKGFILVELIDYYNSDEGQRFARVRKPFESGITWVVNKLTPPFLSEALLGRFLGAYRPWTEIETFRAINTARNTGFINENAYQRARKAFGVSAFGAGYQAWIKGAGEETKGFVGRGGR